MDLVSYLEWLYRQDLVKIHHGQLPFLGSSVTESFALAREHLSSNSKFGLGALASLRTTYQKRVKTACFSRCTSDFYSQVFQYANCCVSGDYYLELRLSGNCLPTASVSGPIWCQHRLSLTAIRKNTTVDNSNS